MVYCLWNLVVKGLYRNPINGLIGYCKKEAPNTKRWVNSKGSWYTCLQQSKDNLRSIKQIKLK